MRMPLRALRSRGSAVILAGTLVIGPTLLAGAAHAATPTTHAATVVTAVVPHDIGDVCQTALPSQADDTLNLIASDGPFPYSEDGEVFDNNEGLLPAESTGYYHSYTVVTPGASNRGTRRIITAEDGTDYYTSDHYDSFSTIDTSC
ncbi:ribonuclease domain-containing protein [Streptomyces sp. SL13]|uniref:Ribonuclease domain-containing protein n=1 Tax=Streptantibioticus silvisoli TaxID=2705255 RepID=A0AA90H611_9ACTN|nr:ribonuclease domain-containing protein [Streptantibioticus silvisoli]MDI5971618.1 ribonuclease domain-containing protein [Streptantibioticus silvisoli]